jgi:uncharacterized phage protein (TIGR01671 family)
MRPIKFRAVLHLDKIDEKIPAIDIMIGAVAVYPDGSIGFPEEALKEKLPKGYAIYSNEFGANIYYSDEEGEYFENVFELLAGDEWFWVEKDFDLMQFTGLLDKEGIEIFEGDIVKWDDESDGKYWRFAVVEINPDIQFNCRYFKMIKGIENSSMEIFPYGTFAYQETDKHLIVIGNKYEGIKK